MNIFPKLALGTWLMGGTKDPNPDNDDQADIDAIQLAIDCGITLIDTAQNYANGKCEELVGEALVNVPRDAYQILTKQRKDSLTYDQVIAGCHQSMQRLKVDYIDYFVCHAPNPDVDMTEFFKASNELLGEGKIRNVGVSNFGPKMLELAVKTSDTPIRLNQVHFSLDDDDVLRSGTYEFCVKNNITTQAFRSIVDIQNNKDALAILTSLAKQYNLTIQQITLSYLNSYDSMSFTIRSSSKQHWDEIKEALEFKLTAEEIRILRNSHSNLSGAFGHFLSI